jgi:hypothetical protein
MPDKLKTLMEKRMAELEAASNGEVVGVRPNAAAPAAPAAPPAPVTPRPKVKLRPPSALEEELQRETEARRKKRPAPPVVESLKEKSVARKTNSFSDQDY